MAITGRLCYTVHIDTVTIASVLGSRYALALGRSWKFTFKRSLIKYSNIQSFGVVIQATVFLLIFFHI